MKKQITMLCLGTCMASTLASTVALAALTVNITNPVSKAVAKMSHKWNPSAGILTDYAVTDSDDIFAIAERDPELLGHFDLFWNGEMTNINQDSFTGVNFSTGEASVMIVITNGDNIILATKDTTNISFWALTGTDPEGLAVKKIGGDIALTTLSAENQDLIDFQFGTNDGSTYYMMYMSGAGTPTFTMKTFHFPNALTPTVTLTDLTEDTGSAPVSGKNIISNLNGGFFDGKMLIQVETPAAGETTATNKIYTVVITFGKTKYVLTDTNANADVLSNLWYDDNNHAITFFGHKDTDDSNTVGELTMIPDSGAVKYGPILDSTNPQIHIPHQEFFSVDSDNNLYTSIELTGAGAGTQKLIEIQSNDGVKYDQVLDVYNGMPKQSDIDSVSGFLTKGPQFYVVVSTEFANRAIYSVLPSTHDHSKNNTPEIIGIIVGSVIGGIAGLAIISALVWYLYAKVYMPKSGKKPIDPTVKSKKDEIIHK